MCDRCLDVAIHTHCMTESELEEFVEGDYWYCPACDRLMDEEYDDLLYGEEHKCECIDCMEAERNEAQEQVQELREQVASLRADLASAQRPANSSLANVPATGQQDQSESASQQITGSMVDALRGVLEAGNVDRAGIRQISVDIKVTH